MSAPRPRGVGLVYDPPANAQEFHVREMERRETERLMQRRRDMGVEITSNVALSAETTRELERIGRDVSRRGSSRTSRNRATRPPVPALEMENDTYLSNAIKKVFLTFHARLTKKYSLPEPSSVPGDEVTTLYIKPAIATASEIEFRVTQEGRNERRTFRKHHVPLHGGEEITVWVRMT